MEKHPLIPHYLDMSNHTYNVTNYFFLEHLLKARADLHLETGKHTFDQEVNVYLTGLLNSLLSSGSIIIQRPYVSAFDTDVRAWLDAHPGARNEYMVYRDNADFRLLLSGLFEGTEHKGSYQHIVLNDDFDIGRASLYYELAASALVHLQGNKNTLVSVYYALSDTINEIILILKRAASTYFDLLEKITEGSMFHLEKELDELRMKSTYAALLDEFLAVYSRYKENPSDQYRSTLLDLSEKLKKINGAFTFKELDQTS